MNIFLLLMHCRVVETPEPSFIAPGVHIINSEAALTVNNSECWLAECGLSGRCYRPWQRTERCNALCLSPKPSRPHYLVWCHDLWHSRRKWSHDHTSLWLVSATRLIYIRNINVEYSAGYMFSYFRFIFENDTCFYVIILFAKSKLKDTWTRMWNERA